ncbi:MAG: peptidylprolyl isomerase [Archangium sp.]|nr:peptidylprolyl isomerase [Archangium sp.]
MNLLRSMISVAVVVLAGSTMAQGKFTSAAQSGKDLWATFSTTQGDIVVRLYAKDAPKTVANFVGLAEGEKEFTNEATGKKEKRRFYDGLIFHRVIPDFMIQGGDPQGSGRGGPGYTFEDEFQSGRKFDKVGMLAMANRGPATNGSQFFITTSTPRHLNGKHTIFGEVVSGYDVVVAISTVQTAAGNRPVSEVKITKLTISEKPPAAAKGAK